MGLGYDEPHGLVPSWCCRASGFFLSFECWDFNFGDYVSACDVYFDFASDYFGAYSKGTWVGAFEGECFKPCGPQSDFNTTGHS
jgi:hypothetical protein